MVSQRARAPPASTCRDWWSDDRIAGGPDRWPAMRLDRPLCIGATSGHGPVPFAGSSSMNPERIGIVANGTIDNQLGRSPNTS
jgi:hypothetical protein